MQNDSNQIGIYIRQKHSRRHFKSCNFVASAKHPNGLALLLCFMPNTSLLSWFHSLNSFLWQMCKHQRNLKSWVLHCNSGFTKLLHIMAPDKLFARTHLLSVLSSHRSSLHLFRKNKRCLQFLITFMSLKATKGTATFSCLLGIADSHFESH